MRVLFAGSPAIAVPALLAIAARHRVVGVLTNPESAQGRGRGLLPTAVAEAAREDAMLGMRMSDGIGEELAVLAAVVPALESLVADGLVTFAGGRWMPTERGWLFGNEVFSRIWGIVE